MAANQDIDQSAKSQSAKARVCERHRGVKAEPEGILPGVVSCNALPAFTLPSVRGTGIGVASTFATPSWWSMPTFSAVEGDKSTMTTSGAAVVLLELHGTSDASRFRGA